MSQPNSNIISRAWATTGDLNNSGDCIGRARRLRFNSSVHVILIPTVEEYRTAGLGEDMWWCDIDYKSFKDSAVDELRRYLHENSKVDAKMALKYLYQPEMGSGADCSCASSQSPHNSVFISNKSEMTNVFNSAIAPLAIPQISPDMLPQNVASFSQPIVNVEANLMSTSNALRRPNPLSSTSQSRFSITSAPLIY